MRTCHLGVPLQASRRRQLLNERVFIDPRGSRGSSRSGGFLKMRLGMNNQLLRKSALRMAPLALVSATGLHAQWAQPYGYYDDYGRAMHHHQRDEKHELNEHQREERRYYGNTGNSGSIRKRNLVG